MPQPHTDNAEDLGDLKPAAQGQVPAGVPAASAGQGTAVAPPSDPLVLQILSELFNQQAQLQQHLNVLHHTVEQQGHGWQEGTALLRSELQKFQTGGPQRALAALYHKIFRDFIGHLNHLDALVASGREGARGTAEEAWITAIQLTRDQFESLLGNWGVQPMAIAVGVDLFDPEIHEAVTAIEPEVLPDGPEHAIVKVRRRGWTMQDSILQFPQVLVR